MLANPAVMESAMLELIVGNKTYSSWSLRAALVVYASGAPFRETVIPLHQEGSDERKREHSPSGKVPALRDGELVIWESLAIAETLAERYPEAKLWPADPAARAHARAVSHEMHAGFPRLRGERSMNCRAHIPGLPMGPELAAEVKRVQAIWTECRERFGQAGDGPFLYGHFTIADAMYAPVVFRFTTYEIVCEGAAEAYRQAMLAYAPMVAWREAAEAELWTIPAYELGDADERRAAAGAGGGLRASSPCPARTGR